MLHNLRFCLCVWAAAILWLAPLRTAAQTDVQLSQYYELPTLYNPSAIGNTDFLRLRGGGRMQWVGISNAPAAILATADMPFKLGNKRLGVGLVAQGETMGLYSNLQISAQVAYKLRKWGGEFAIGLQLGMFDQGFKGSEVILPDNDDFHQGTDDAIPKRDLHGTAFDMAAGLWYQHPKFYAGFSCTHLMSPTINLKGEEGGNTENGQYYEFQANRTVYFMSGCNIPIKNTLFEVLPSVLVKSDFTFTSGEITMRGRYNKLFTFGIGYRWNDAVYATLGAEFKNFFIGYAYDYSTSAIAKASSGSHEVFLGYSMKIDLSEKNKNKHKSIRIM